MITFKPSTHQFYSGSREVPGVTSIIRAAGLMGSWPIDEWYMKRGEYIHRATALLDEGRLDWSTLDARILPFVECYQKFLAFSKCRIIDSEMVVTNTEESYAGIVDRIVKFPDGSLAVLDMKGGAKQSWHWVQVAAYADCLPLPADLCLLYLNDKGRMPKLMIHTEPKKALNDWRMILAAHLERSAHAAVHDEGLDR